jgi:serine/threonine protein kinase
MVLARLNHPHLVRVTDFFEESGNAYLVMDLVEGESLGHLIEQQGPLPESQVVTWAGQLLDALTYCHAQRTIHRDIKPDNVIIRPNGQAVLVDFGLVKLWNPQDPRTRTAMRGVGTWAYAPPEQYDATSGHTDARSDIYGAGATLYHALTGQVPPTVTTRMVNPAALVPIVTLNQRVSSHTAKAVTKAMELRPADRFQSAYDMWAALPRQPATPRLQRATGTPTVRLATPAQRRRVSVWVWVLSGLAVLALAVGIVVATGAATGRGTSGTVTPTLRVETATALVPTIMETVVRPSPVPTFTPVPTASVTATPPQTATATVKPRPLPTLRPISPTLTPTLPPTPTKEEKEPSGGKQPPKP